MTMLKLWEIAAELDGIEDRIAEAGGELTPEIEAELDALTGDFEAKAERVALYYRQLIANAEAAGVEVSRLTRIQRRYKAGAERIRGYLHRQMQVTETQEVKTALVTVSRRLNPAAISFDGDPASLPEEFQRVTVSADKAALKAAHKEGRELPAGVHVERGESLRVR